MRTVGYNGLSILSSLVHLSVVVDHPVLVVPKDVLRRLGVLTQDTDESQAAAHRHVLLGPS